MKRSRCSETQIVSIFKEAEAGVPVEELCQKHGFNQSAFYKGKAKYSGIEVDTSLPAKRVIRVLEVILSWRGCPKQIRLDNGPEFISHRLENWAKQHIIQLVYIQPGKPAQNAYIERFNRTFREDILNAYLFNSLKEVRDISEQWLEEYNAVRPHEALPGLSPYQFAVQNT